MIIHHYVPFTSNVGDLFVRDGIHLRLHEQFRGATIIELPANDPHRRSHEPVGLVGVNLARSNAEADLVIVGGSNLYEGPEWRFITSVDAVQALRPPLAFIGLGIGSVRGQRERPLSEKSLAEIRVSHERALGVAVRDTNTVEFLHGLGLSCRMTACPATFVGRKPMHLSPVRRVVVSAPPVRFLPKWGHKGYVRSALMRATFRDVLKSLAKQEIEFEVIAHDDRDVEYLGSLLSEFGQKPLYLGNDPRPYYEHFQKADFAICYRLHMAISCLGWGVPFSLVNFDLRTEAFRNTYDIGEITYDAFKIGAMRQLIRDMGDLKNLPNRKEKNYRSLEQRRETFWTETNVFYSELAVKMNHLPSNT